MGENVIEELAPGEYETWTKLNADSPSGSIYSDPIYLAALCDATGARFRILGVKRGDQLDGGVALYEQRSLSGRFVSPRLLLYYSGPVIAPYRGKYPSERTSREVDVLTQIVRKLDDMGYDAVTLKGLPAIGDVRPFIAAGWRVRPAYSYVVPLGHLDQQWQKVEQNLRRLVKRCSERDKLDFAADNDIDTFLRLHETTLSRKGAAGYLPKPAFKRFLQTLSGNGMATIFHARLPDGHAVATQLVLHGSYPGTHTVCAGGDSEYARLGAHAFLRWRVFEYLAERGYATNDLTDAALGPVTHFKAQLGGELVMAHVLERPSSRRFASVQGAGALAARARGAAGRIVRRVAGQRRP